uniref:Uncharacterized protein n=2 Tax=Pseudomonadaceae TaxID=135621 RepID=B7XGN4_PSEPU|nr:hypothetical protein [Pseudomonas resinovorans]BAH10042.1 hypothetical protein [Pseudomonas putida]
MRSGSVLIMHVMSHKKAEPRFQTGLKIALKLSASRQLDIDFSACLKTRSGEITSRQGGSPSASFANGEHHENSYRPYRSCCWWHSTWLKGIRFRRCNCSAVSHRRNDQGASLALIQ